MSVSPPVNLTNRRPSIGGSDGDDEAALLRLWWEKRAEVEPADLSANFITQSSLVE